MSFFGSFEVLDPPATPVHYGIEEGQEGFTAEDYDPYTSSDDLGSTAELGGTQVQTATYDLPDDANVVNLTGMSESPMTPVTTGNGANVNGSGQAGQQIPSRAAAESWISQVYESVARGITRQGTTTTTTVQAASTAPATGSAPPVLMQSPVAGISLHGNLVLFFIIGVIIAVVVFD
jgi:hypothetical protein